MGLKYEFAIYIVDKTMGSDFKDRIKYDGQQNFDIDVKSITHTMEGEALAKINSTVQNDELSDFEAIEQIICIITDYENLRGIEYF